MNRTNLIAPFLLVVLVSQLVRPAATSAQSGGANLNQMSIEDLMSLEITSASRKQQRAADVAAAVFVITSADIRRSGLTTIPDLLRMAPGVDVAQINANKWAVSVRGFNSLYANKLLVLVDGRSAYNRIFSGVVWDAEELMVDDIDRIEVIRGPGAAIWGANAMNGVINIVTKSAAATQGVLVRADGGGAGAQGGIRYGGTVGPARYRLFAQWTGRNESLLIPGRGANDASHSVTTGFRSDWTDSGAFMLQGTLTAGRARVLWPNLDPATAALAPSAHEPSDAHSGRLFGRWTHVRPGGAALQIQSFIDTEGRQLPAGSYDRQTYDIETQYHAAVGARHDVVAGAGYRFSHEQFAGGAAFSFTPAEDRSTLLTAFVQDEIALFGNRLAVTLGSQVQHESMAGGGFQPTARVMWKALPRQRVWAAASRALRTPSLQDRGIRVEFPPVPGPTGLPVFRSVAGNSAALTETLVDAEAGYRLEIGAAASIDVTGFAGRYEHLRTLEVAAPVVRFAPSPRIVAASQYGNQLEAATRGVEVAGHWMPLSQWRLDASYTAFRITPHLAATSTDAAAAITDASAPRAQWQLRSAWSPSSRATLHLALFRVGRLELYDVDAYSRADFSAEWRFTNHLSVMAVGQNLLDAAHFEFADAGSFVRSTQAPRRVGLRLLWTSR